MIADARSTTRLSEVVTRAREAADARATAFLESLAEYHREMELRESAADPYANYVDPADAYRDADGTWMPIGGAGKSNASQSPMDWNGFVNEQQLQFARESCRRMFTYSEHVVNGHRNRVHYIIDTGHTYTAAPCDGEKGVDAKAVKETQKWVDEFRKENDWFAHQCEFQLRLDRDGEVFRRKFKDADGMLRVEFIEPWQVTDPPAPDANTEFGIECEPGRATKPVAYWVRSAPNVEPERIEAEHIQHIKANVSRNVRRGVPLVWVARKNILRAANSLRNIAAKVEIAAAHCLKKTLPAGTPATAASTFATAGTVQRQNTFTGATTYGKTYSPGMEVTTSDAVQWEALNLAEGVIEMVEGNKEVLRALAVAFGQPEFMLTSDASNGNYSSTMVAEGPVVRGFRNGQQIVKEADGALIEEARNWAVECGRLPANSVETIEINIGLPNLVTRDEAKEAEKHRIYKELGIVSPQTISGEIGVDYSQEQANIEEYEKTTGRKWGAPEPMGLAGDVDENGDVVDGGRPGSPPSRKPNDAAVRRAAVRAQLESLAASGSPIEEAYRLLRESLA
jgi:hypothetical protein